MSTQVGATADILLRRVRAYGGIAYTSSDTYTLLSRAQRLLNAGLKRVTTSTALSTKKQKLIYSIPTSLTSCIDIISVTESTRTVPQCNWQDFYNYDIDWFRNVTGTRYEAWAQVGRSLLILYPGSASSGGSVTVHHTKLTTALTASTQTFELPDEDIGLVLNVAEIILLIDLRMFTHASERIKDLLEEVALQFGVPLL